MNDGFIFFWQTDNKSGNVGPGCMSQWARSGFVVDGAYYRYAEQYMMAEKARLFHDDKALDKIMDAKSPMIMKHLGRTVKGRNGGAWDMQDSKTWEAECFDVVVRGNFAKFSQNDDLKAFLLSTGNAVIAEASPKDDVWGIGINAKTAAETPQDVWPGQNLLGKALMKVRDMLQAGKGETKAVKANRELLEKYLEEEASQKAISKDMSEIRVKPGKTRESKLVDHASQDPDVPTDKQFAAEMKSVVENMSAYRVHINEADKGATGFQILDLVRSFSPEERELFNKFDKLYRGHVYRFLLRKKEDGGCGFFRQKFSGELIPVKKISDTGELSGADVFVALWAKLFGVRCETPRSGRKKKELKSYFLDFDFTQSNVGRGAFRRYLNMLTVSVVTDLTTKDMVPLKDVHGHVIHGKNGKPIYVPRSGLDSTEESNEHEQAAARARQEQIIDENRKRRSKRNLELHYLAYFRLMAEEKICPDWFRPFAKEIFEMGKDGSEVKYKAVKARIAPSGISFDTELSRLREKVRALADDLWDSIYGYAVVRDEDGRIKRIEEPRAAIEHEWDELALYVGYKRMHDIRYNIIRGLVDSEEMKELVEKGLL